MIGIDIAGTFARFTIFAISFRISIITGSAGFAASTIIARKTVATYFVSFFIYLTASGKIIGWNRQRTSANEAISRSSSGSISVITLFAEFTMVTRCTVFAIL